MSDWNNSGIPDPMRVENDRLRDQCELLEASRRALLRANTTVSLELDKAVGQNRELREALAYALTIIEHPDVCAVTTRFALPPDAFVANCRKALGEGKS